MRKHYYLYIDDSGSRFPDKKQIGRNDGMNCFALGGILVEETHKIILEETYKVFCEKWKIGYPLHSTKIRGKRDDFSWLEKSAKDNERFLGELEELMISIPVIGFAVVINRDGYNSRYKDKYGNERWLMCKTAYNILMERVSKYVMRENSTFEVCFEEVGKMEDRAIVQYGRDLKSVGLPFNKDTSAKYRSLSVDDFKKVMLGDPSRKKKENLFVQIADLYLYPMIKRKYDEAYRPWNVLFNNKKVIDSILTEEDVAVLGIKYSCFDSLESKNPE